MISFIIALFFGLMGGVTYESGFESTGIFFLCNAACVIWSKP